MGDYQHSRHSAATLREHALGLRRVLRARQSRFPVMFLSGGGAYAHVDARRTSVAGAVAWALDAGLQGLVLEAGAVQAQPAAVASARRKGLQARTAVLAALRHVTLYMEV